MMVFIFLFFEAQRFLIMEKSTLNSMQYIIFWVIQGFEQHKDVYMMTEFSFKSDQTL